MRLKHIIESQQFDRKTIETIFRTADALQKRNTLPMKGKILASLFYEPSTRTRLSFEAAMIRLGGNVITTENAKQFSSAVKGETLEDTIRVVSHYANVIVLRHYEAGASKRAAAVSRIPIINAGDGAGQHPTQALLDLYTIQKELGKIDRIKIAFVGDLKYGRTVRSLAYLLTKYKDVQINLVSPTELKLRQDVKDFLKQHHTQYREMEDWDPIINKVDVLYQTRIQKERFKNMKEYITFKGKYILTLSDTKKMKPGSIVMHPLPRVDEISPEVDQSPKAVYFKQAQYGVIIRMALLQLLVK